MRVALTYSFLQRLEISLLWSSRREAVSHNALDPGISTSHALRRSPIAADPFSSTFFALVIYVLALRVSGRAKAKVTTYCASRLLSRWLNH